MHNSIRIPATQLLRKIHSNRNNGMTFSQISRWYCEMKGYEYDLHEPVNIGGSVQYFRVHRGVASPTLAKLRREKCLTKFGDRIMLTAEGIRRLQKSGY